MVGFAFQFLTVAHSRSGNGSSCDFYLKHTKKRSERESMNGRIKVANLFDLRLGSPHVFHSFAEKKSGMFRVFQPYCNVSGGKTTKKHRPWRFILPKNPQCPLWKETAFAISPSHRCPDNIYNVFSVQFLFKNQRSLENTNQSHLPHNNTKCKQSADGIL